MADIDRQTALLCLVLILGAALRLGFLGRQSLWVDEAVSFWRVFRPWGELHSYLLGGTFRPLYFAVLRLFLPMGSSEWILRLPSALAGILSIILIYRLGAGLFDRSTGLVAALFLAVSPLHIWYSQEARMYAQVGLLGLSAGLFALRGLRDNRLLDWILLGIVEGLALWTESAGIWIAISLNIAALLVVRWLWRAGRFWPWAASQAIALLFLFPLLARYVGTMGGATALWIPHADLLRLARLITDFAGSFWRTPLESRLVLACLLAWVLLKGKDLRREACRFRVRYTFLACTLLAPIAISFAISQPYLQIPLLDLVFTPGRSIFLPRNLIIASFPLYLLLGRSLFLGSRRAGIAVLACLLVLSLVASLGNLLPERKDDFRAAAALVKKQVQPDDIILFAPAYLELPFNYYYLKHDENFGLVEAIVRDGVLDRESEGPFTDPIEALEYHPRVWLVTTTNIYQTDSKGIQASIAARGELLEEYRFLGVALYLYEIKPPIH